MNIRNPGPGRARKIVGYDAVRAIGTLRWRFTNWAKERSALKRIRTAEQWLPNAIENHVAKVRATGDIFFPKAFFSQNGEDGVLSAIIDRLGLTLKGGSIEFGFSIFENNTVALSLARGHRALFLDGSQREVDKANKLIRLMDLKSVSAQQAFITKENINKIIGHAWSGHLDVLSIDVDGNDYWLWEALTVVDPTIVIIEYNASFGKKRSVTTPYKSNFDRLAEHSFGLYHGASLRALCQLGRTKGYTFCGVDAEGLNAYFVKQALLPNSDGACVEDAFRSHGPRLRRGLSQAQQEEMTSGFDLIDIPTDKLL